MKINESKLVNIIKECFNEVVKEELAGYGISDNMNNGEEKLQEVDGYGVSGQINNAQSDVQEMARQSDPTGGINSLIDQANQAYNNARQQTENDDCLLGGRDEAGFYGLVQPIRLQRGSVVIITKGPYDSDNDTEVIKCFRTVRGVTVKVSDDEAYPYGGYQYAVKRLKRIIRDAQRGIEYSSTIDPNWDDKTQEKFGRKYGL